MKEDEEANLSLLAKLYQFGLPHKYPRGIGGNVIVVRTRVLIEWFGRWVYGKLIGEGSLKALKSRKAAHDADFLVVASGPSTLNIDISRVSKLKDDGTLKVVFLNHVWDTPIGKKVCPDFYVLSDPLTSPKNRNLARTEALWLFLEMNPSIKLVVPRSWKMELHNFAERVIYFEDKSLQGWTRSISPVRPRGYKSNTTLKALAFSTYVCPRTVFVAGFDNSLFLGVQNRDGSFVREANHAQGSAVPDIYLATYHSRGLQDLFFDVAQTCFEVETCFAGKGIVNLSARSYIDALPFEDPLLIMKGQREFDS